MVARAASLLLLCLLVCEAKVGFELELNINIDETGRFGPPIRKGTAIYNLNNQANWEVTVDIGRNSWDIPTYNDIELVTQPFTEDVAGGTLVCQALDEISTWLNNNRQLCRQASGANPRQASWYMDFDAVAHNYASGTDACEVAYVANPAAYDFSGGLQVTGSIDPARFHDFWVAMNGHQELKNMINGIGGASYAAMAQAINGMPTMNGAPAAYKSLILMLGGYLASGARAVLKYPKSGFSIMWRTDMSQIVAQIRTALGQNAQQWLVPANIKRDAKLAGLRALGCLDMVQWAKSTTAVCANIFNRRFIFENGIRWGPLRVSGLFTLGNPSRTDWIAGLLNGNDRLRGRTLFSSMGQMGMELLPTQLANANPGGAIFELRNMLPTAQLHIPAANIIGYMYAYYKALSSFNNNVDITTQAFLASITNIVTSNYGAVVQTCQADIAALQQAQQPVVVAQQPVVQQAQQPVAPSGGGFVELQHGATAAFVNSDDVVNRIFESDPAQEASSLTGLLNEVMADQKQTLTGKAYDTELAQYSWIPLITESDGDKVFDSTAMAQFQQTQESALPTTNQDPDTTTTFKQLEHQRGGHHHRHHHHRHRLRRHEED